MKRNSRRLREYGGDTSTYYWHGEGVSDLVSFIAETMDDEVPAGGLVGEMYSYSGDGQPRIEENGGRGGKTFVEMSLFAPFDLPYTTGYEFSDKLTQHDYERKVNEFSKLAEKNGIPYDSDEWLEEFIDYFAYDVVEMQLICEVQEYSDSGAKVDFKLLVQGSEIDKYNEYFDTEELLNHSYEKRLISIIKDFYDEV